MRYWLRWAGGEAAEEGFKLQELKRHTFRPPDPAYAVGDVMFLVVGPHRPNAHKWLIGWQLVEDITPEHQLCRMMVRFKYRFTPEDLQAVPQWRSMRLPAPAGPGGRGANGVELSGAGLMSLARLIHRKGEPLPAGLEEKLLDEGGDLIVPHEPYVFFAWQQDLPAEHHHYFIRDALKAALKGSSEETLQEAPRPAAKVLSGAEKVPGMPDIPAVIQARIRHCTVFVADLTFTSRTRGRKRVPNGNVLFELGCAVGRDSEGWDRVICVLNTHHGGWSDMLFDLRHRRKAIEYCLPPNADSPTIRAEQRKLAAKLKDALVFHRPALNTDFIPARGGA